MNRILFFLVVVTMASGCASRRSVARSAEPSGVTVSPAPADVRFEEGEASWYGDPYHGRQAASGETFDKNKMTAAHRTLPFNTWVRVENKLNDKSVDVRINDRGPFVAGRIIDLSEGAARKIDMIRAGVVPIRLTVVRDFPAAATVEPQNDLFYVVQLGAFENQDRAQSLARRFEEKYIGIYVERPSEESALYKVRIGRALLADARYVQDLLRREDDLDAIVVQMRQ